MIRVLVANLPRMLGEIAARLVAQQPDMEVVSSNTEVEVTPALVAALNGDVLVLTTAAAPGAIAREFLAARPALRVICVAGDGRTASCFHMDAAAVGGRIVERNLPELDVPRLIQAIRGDDDAG